MNLRKTIGILLSLFVIGGGVFIANAVQGAGTATFSLSPASGSHAQNTTFVVSVYENSGAATVNGIQANLSYDTTKLQYAGVDNTGSPFTDAQSTATGGVVLIGRYIGLSSTPVSGSQLVAKVSFKVLASSGSTAINFASSSGIIDAVSDLDIKAASSPGASFTLTAPATTPPPAPSPSPAPAPAPAPAGTPKTTTPAPTPPATPPAAPSTPTKTTSTGTPTTTPTTSTTGQTYFVGVKVTDDLGKPVANATVTIDKTIIAITDASGVASFTTLTAGKHTVVVKNGSKVLASSITVDGTKKPIDAQVITLGFKSSITWLPIIEISMLALAIMAIGLWIGRRSRLAHAAAYSSHYTATTQAPVATAGYMATSAPTATPVAPTATPVTRVFMPDPLPEDQPNEPTPGA
jgi:hypothetical protein